MSKMSLNTYIMFPGTCREAMSFYADCLNGNVTLLQTYAESPVPNTDDTADRIFNAKLEGAGILLMASDDLPSHPVTRGTNFSLFLNFDNQETQRSIFDKLSEGGSISFPLENGFGMFTDRFGIQWMLAFHP